MAALFFSTFHMIFFLVYFALCFSHVERLECAFSLHFRFIVLYLLRYAASQQVGFFVLCLISMQYAYHFTGTSFK